MGAGTFFVQISDDERALLNRVLITGEVLHAVATERVSQFEKWGVQDHPMIGGLMPRAHTREYARLAANWKSTNDMRVENETLGFDGILLEEVFEALEEPDYAKQRAELVQAAAVVVAMIEALDRKAAKEKAA